MKTKGTEKGRRRPASRRKTKSNKMRPKIKATINKRKQSERETTNEDEPKLPKRIAEWVNPMGVGGDKEHRIGWVLQGCGAVGGRWWVLGGVCL